MALEWREATCEDCGASFERTWSVLTHKKGVAIPKGYRVETSGKTWNRIGAPTADTTLCLCDTAC
jgi:hypothetical protein